MFEVQHHSELLRPGKAADGPPYGTPGDWLTLTQSYPSLDEAVAAAERTIQPWAGQTRRDETKYRIRETNWRGNLIATYDVHGELTFAAKRKAA